MRSLLVLAALLTTLTTSMAHAQRNSWGSGGPFGLGIILGEPSAITARYNLDKVRAIDGGISFFYSRWTLLYIDGLYQFQGAFGRANSFFAQTTPYIGLGGVLVISDLPRRESRRERYFSDSDSTDLAFGLRIPLGAEWRAVTAPIGVFAEIAPGLTILPGTNSFIQLGIGARFYF